MKNKSQECGNNVKKTSGESDERRSRIYLDDEGI